VITFSTFLLGCIDYTILWDSNHLSDVVVPQCLSRFVSPPPSPPRRRKGKVDVKSENRFSGLTTLLVVTFAVFYSWRVIRFGMGVRKLWEMHEFYTELLEVPEVRFPFPTLPTRSSRVLGEPERYPNYPLAFDSHPTFDSEGFTSFFPLFHFPSYPSPGCTRCCEPNHEGRELSHRLIQQRRSKPFRTPSGVGTESIG